MSEETWGSEGAETPQKKRIPTWLMFCGGGCLLAVILAVIGIGWVITKAKHFANADEQLPELAKVLPFDELPPDVQFKVHIPIPFDMYIMSDARGYAVVIYHSGDVQAPQLRSTLLNKDFNGGVAGMGGRKDLKAIKVTVQGRELEGLRFYQEVGRGGAGGNNQGHSVIIEVTPEGEEGIVAVQLTNTGGAGDVTDDELIDFLKPFHVGKQR